MISLIRMSLLYIVLGLSAGQALADSVIVSLDVKAQAINKNFLLAAFAMRITRWPDGRPIRVFVLPDRHPLHQRFVKQRLQVFPYQLRNNWDRQVFTGTGAFPVTVDNMEEMYRMVSQTEGSIGYIADSVKLSPEKVRVVDEF
ncbi:hypothetical protein [Amphritea atlantica]|jgi:glycerophosphoryl diester phosphodiesterase|uniref:hypothetical protein n=1 Tax=Amphritea atlantica TaxID=355243 RepID=UPI001FDFF269|nr:hypothetical protein [Amphritea atlantica]